MRRADHSSRGVLPSVVSNKCDREAPPWEAMALNCVEAPQEGWGRLKNEEAMTRVGSQPHKKKGGRPLRQSVNFSGLCVLSNCLLQ